MAQTKYTASPNGRNGHTVARGSGAVVSADKQMAVVVNTDNVRSKLQMTTALKSIALGLSQDFNKADKNTLLPTSGTIGDGTVTIPTLPVVLPNEIADLGMWFSAKDASDIVGGPVEVTSWLDKSGNGNHMVGSVSPTPDYVTNDGDPYLDFQAGQGFETTISSYPMDEGTVFVVSENEELTASPQGRTLTLGANDLSMIHIGNASVNYTSSSGGSIAVAARNNGAEAAFGASKVDVIHWEDNVSLEAIDAVNGIKIDDTVTTLSPVTKFSLGKRDNESTFFKGKIREVICYNRRLSGAEIDEVYRYLTAEWTDVEARIRRFLENMDVFLIAGQSNSVGGVNGSPIEPQDQVIDANVFEAATFSDITTLAISPCINPMRGPGDRDTSVCWGPDFGRAYAAANPGRNVVLFNAGVGSTSFSGNDWNQGDTEYNNAVSVINDIMALYPTATFKGILWHQGENDATTGMTQAAYEALFDAFLDDIRTDITAAGPTTPCVVGQMLQSWVDLDSGRDGVQDAITATPGRKAFTGLVNTQDLTSIDGLHFDTASMRTMGGRYHAAYVSALGNS